MDDEEDRFSNNSGESGQDNDNENEADEVMEDADDGDNDNDGDQDDENNDDEDNDNEDDNDNDDEDGDGDGSGRVAIKEDGTQDANGTEDPNGKKPSTPSRSTPKAPWPTLRPEALTAKQYDIVPTMAAPQATSVNAMAITPDLRYWITGGSDGYIRKYDGPGTINGKLALTVAQRHPFVDSVTKAGILMSYWENDEPSPPGRGEADHVLSPVYAVAIHSQALWLLSGLESGGINLQSVRHDEGKRIACLQQHTGAVSVLTMAPNERSVLSGGWDKNMYDWDLDTGTTKRSFDGSGGQISSIELRPASGAPVPTISDEPIPSNTISTNNGAPLTNGGAATETNGNTTGATESSAGAKAGEASGSPGNDSLWGGGSDAGSLFGETAGEQPFGRDDDDEGYGGGMEMIGANEGGMDHSADMAMASSGPGETETGQKQPSNDPVNPDTAPATIPNEDAMDVDTAPNEAEPAPIVKEEPSEAEPVPEPGPSPQASSVPQGDAWEAPQSTKAEPDLKAEDRRSSTVVTSPPPATNHDPSQTSPHTFLSSTIDGTIRIWDRRVPNPVARMGTRVGVPPWCMSAVWSFDGNMIYAGRRNGTVEEFDIHKAKRGWEPERTLRFPVGSGPISCLKPMANGRHLVW